MDGFTLIVRNKEEEKAYKKILEMPKKDIVDMVSILVIPDSKTEYRLPTILTNAKSYHGEKAVKSFIFHL